MNHPLKVYEILRKNKTKIEEYLKKQSDTTMKKMA